MPLTTVEPPDDMDSIYDEGEQKPSAETSEPETVDEETAEGETAVVDNKVLAPEGEPLKAGDEIVIRVVKVFGNESEIEYAPKKSTEETSGETMEGANAELDTMNEKGM